MKKMIRTLCLLIGILSVLCMTAYAANPTFEEAFPDPVFRQYVTGTVLSGNTESKADTAVITDAQMKKIGAWTEMDVSNKGISSLQGIKHFTDLQKLSCSYNNLTELDVSSLTSLNYLSCSDNNLTQLDTSGCVRLVTLRCENNNLPQLDTSGCVSLHALYCENNNLTELDVSSLTGLDVLHCFNNSLTELDVSNCTGLVRIECYGNNLSKLDVHGCHNLSELVCYDNSLTELNVDNNFTLEVLVCYNNALTALDLRNNTNFIYVDFSSQTPNKTEAPVLIHNDGTYTLDMEAFLGENGNAQYVTMTDSGVLENGIVTYTARPTKVTYAYATGEGYMDVSWTPVFASGIIADGEIGETITWTLYEDGLLYIEGTGGLPGYDANGMPWVFYREQVKALEISDGITSIGACTFYGHPALETVKLGRDVGGIGNNTFAYCTKLKEITISDNLGMAHYDGHRSFAFEGTPIETVYVPATVQNVGDNFRNKATIAEFVAEGDGVDGYFDVDGVLYHRDEYTGAQTLVKAPSAMDLPATYEVYANTTAISNTAFYNNDSFSYLELCDGLLTIGTEAFYDCDHLITVNFANALTTVGDSAFRHCDRLLLVSLPDTAKIIGSDAFNECGYLQNVKLGRGVTDISHRAFANCPVLTTITVSDAMGMAHYDGHRSFAFEGTPITVVNVPATVTSIPDNFYNKATIAKFVAEGDGVDGYFDVDNILYHRNDYTAAQTLVKVPHAMDLPDTYKVYANTTAIGAKAFFENDSFTELKLCDGLQTIGSEAFHNCDSLTTVDFANSLLSIGENAFQHCDQLISVDLPDTVTYVKSDAFNGCGKLEEVQLGRGVTDLGARAFANCPVLTELTISDAMSMAHYDGHSSFAFHNTPITMVYVPATVTSIPDNFYNKTTIAFFDAAGSGVQGYFDIGGVLHHRVEYTGEQTLVKVPHRMDLPDSYLIYPGTTVIGAKAFYNNDSFTELKLCSDLVTIGSEAFRDCDYIQSIDFGSTLISIGESAFQHCDRLVTIELPDTVIYVGNDAFNECGWLEEVKLGRGVTDIGARAFANCPKLTELTISDAMGMAHYDGHSSFAFHNSPITTVYVPATVTSISDNFYKKATIAYFDGAGDGRHGYFDVDGVLYHRDRYTETQTLIKVPASMVLTDTFTVYAGTTVIADYAAEKHNTFTGLVLPESLVTIGIHAFSNCDDLEEVVIPNGVTQIWDYAFHHCDWLSKVTIGKNVTMLGYNAFSENGKLVEMYFRGNAPEVGKYVFRYLPAEFIIWYPEEATGWSTPTWNGCNAYPYSPMDLPYAINSLTITDLSGTELEAMPDELFHAVISITNQTEEYAGGTVMLAVYTADGQFSTWTYITMKDCPAGATMEFALLVDNRSGDVGALKAFVTSGTGSMEPLGDAVEFGK